MKILVVGPLPDQFEHIRRRCSGLPVELRYADKDAGFSTRGCEHAIMTRHCAHKYRSFLVAKLGAGRISMVSGGISGAVAEINNLVNKPKGD